tara:strand:+ start:711 stop:911 length:201 start_codon:yes stop_codon:yes gene_type:complete
MDHQEAESLAKALKELACKSCTEGWLEKHDGLTDPIKDIQDCATLGLITSTLGERLINEIQEIKKV